MKYAHSTGRIARSLALGATILAGISSFAAEASDRLLVGVDRAQLLRIDVPVDTVIIGNPAIADASVYDETTLILTGKSFGETNMIVLDSLGKVVREVNLTVSTPSDTVTMHKGGNRLSYTCAPTCERTLRAGDAAESFTALQGQVSGSLDLGRSQAGKR